MKLTLPALDHYDTIGRLDVVAVQVDSEGRAGVDGEGGAQRDVIEQGDGLAAADLGHGLGEVGVIELIAAAHDAGDRALAAVEFNHKLAVYAAARSRAGDIRRDVAAERAAGDDRVAGSRAAPLSAGTSSGAVKVPPVT